MGIVKFAAESGIVLFIITPLLKKLGGKNV